MINMSKMVRYKISGVPEPSKKDWDRVKAIKDEDKIIQIFLK